MSAEVLHLTFESRPLRVIVAGGEPWFATADIGRILGYTRLHWAIRRHLAPGEAWSCRLRKSGPPQSLVSEGAIIRLARTRGEAAQRLVAWIAAEVTPAVERRSQAGSAVLDLPFVRDDAQARRVFWSVTSTGEHAVDCALGARYANLALTCMANERLPGLLGWIVSDMLRPARELGGIEVGFFREIARRAMQP